MRFQDKVVIVTGGASGIGKATVFEFVKEGAKAVIADLSDEGQAYSEGLNKKGYDTIFVQTDVTNEDSVKNLIEKTVEKYDKLDVMFANAGIFLGADFHDLDLKSWQKMIDVNLTGVFLSDKHAIEQFQKQGNGGTIVNTASIHSFDAKNQLNPYSASKGGVKMLTQQAASKYSKEGIRTNAVAPGYTRTAMNDDFSQEALDELAELHPIGRLGKPEEIARAVLFLASDEAPFISGATLSIDGGYTAV